MSYYYVQPADTEDQVVGYRGCRIEKLFAKYSYNTIIIGNVMNTDRRDAKHVLTISNII